MILYYIYIIFKFLLNELHKNKINKIYKHTMICYFVFAIVETGVF